MSAVPESTSAPELTASELLSIQRSTDFAFWPFVVAFGAKVLATFAVLNAYRPYDPSAARPYIVANGVLFVLLAIAYVFVAIALTTASRRLGRNPSSVVAWFVALPCIVAVLATGGMVGLVGFGGFVGFIIVNGLYASPSAIWLSIRRDIESRLEDLSRIQ